jgi:hypothetical protein
MASNISRGPWEADLPSLIQGSGHIGNIVFMKLTDDRQNSLGEQRIFFKHNYTSFLNAGCRYGARLDWLRGLCPSPFYGIGQISDPPDKSRIFVGVYESGYAGLDQFGFPHAGSGAKLPPDIQGLFQGVQIVTRKNGGLHGFLSDSVVDGDNQIALFHLDRSSLLSVYMIPYLKRKVNRFFEN